MKHRFRTQVWDKAISGAILGLLVLFGLTAPGFPQVKLQPLRVRVGEKAPNFALLSTSRKAFSLSQFAGHNVLIDFYEGYWRPYCNFELGEFTKHYDEFKALNVQIIAVSVDPIESSGNPGV